MVIAKKNVFLSFKEKYIECRLLCNIDFENKTYNIKREYCKNMKIIKAQLT